MTTLFDQIDRHNEHLRQFEIYRESVFDHWAYGVAKGDGCICPAPRPTMTNAGTDAMVIDPGHQSDPDCPWHGDSEKPKWHLGWF